MGHLKKNIGHLKGHPKLPKTHPIKTNRKQSKRYKTLIIKYKNKRDLHYCKSLAPFAGLEPATL